MNGTSIQPLRASAGQRRFPLRSPGLEGAANARSGDRPHVLIVEDDGMVALHLEELVAEMGYRVVGVATTAFQAINLARSTQPSAILMDVRLRGERDGIMAATEIRAQQSVPVVFITGSSDPTTLGRIHALDPAGLLIKPIRPEALRRKLAEIFGRE